MSVNVNSGGQGDGGESAGEQRARIQRQLRAIAALLDSNEVPDELCAEILRLVNDHDTPTPEYLVKAAELFQQPSVRVLRSAVIEPGTGDRGGDLNLFRGRMPEKARWRCPVDDCHREANGDRSRPFDREYCDLHPGVRLVLAETP